MSLLALWLTAIALAVTLYDYGQVRYYWYASDEGRGYALTTWKGDSLDNDRSYPKGYTYRYDIYRFERNAEARTIVIILILAGASAASFKLLKRPRITQQARDT